MDIFNLLAGKRTYIVAFLTALIGLLAAFGIELPEWLMYILGGLGLTTLRAAIPPTPPPTS